jgi:hypothetical protein
MKSYTRKKKLQEDRSSVYLIFGWEFQFPVYGFIFSETCKAFVHPVYTIFVVNLYSKAEHEIKWTLTIVVFHVQPRRLIREVTLQI